MKRYGCPNEDLKFTFNLLSLGMIVRGLMSAHLVYYEGDAAEIGKGFFCFIIAVFLYNIDFNRGVSTQEYELAGQSADIVNPNDYDS